MNAFVLTLREPPRQRVDLSPLAPERLREGAGRDVARIELVSGNRRLPAGDLFHIEPGDPHNIVIRGSCARLDFIGAGMRQGSLTVEGDAGAYLGQGMRGGLIEIGDAAGDFLGGAPPGEMRGMSGGVVVVRGRAGDRAGDRMRRGIIVVEGEVGPYAGSRMIAGTLVVLGSEVGPYPGFGMKRGTLWLRCPPGRNLPTFADGGRHELGYLRILRKALAEVGAGSRPLQELGLRVRRFIGDAAVAGKGEILVSQS